VPLPLLLGAKSALGLAAGAEAARATASKLARFAHEVDETTKTLTRIAGHQAPAAQPAAPPDAEHHVVAARSVEPELEHPELVWKHKETPGWFVRKCVKVRFVEQGQEEYNWVQVLAAVPGRRSLVGRFVNLPELVDADAGDVVTFPMSRIVDVQVDAKRKSRKSRKSRKGRKSRRSRKSRRARR